MKAGPYLRQYKQAEEDIRLILYRLTMQRMKDAERLVTIREQMILPANPPDGMPKGTGSFDPIPSGLAREDEILRHNAQYRQKLIKDMEQLKELMSQIEATVAKVENDIYRTVLEGKYIRGKTWSQLAKELELEEVYVRKKIRYKAFKELEKWI